MFYYSNHFLNHHTFFKKKVEAAQFQAQITCLGLFKSSYTQVLVLKNNSEPFKMRKWFNEEKRRKCLAYEFALTHCLGVFPVSFLKKVLKTVLELKPLS